ncbi:MAG: aminoacyl-tRNA hydrolase [Gemmatimonas sp.]|nr:aminoacyl-tRNA hydrolase [Gemmatimonas sp.]
MAAERQPKTVLCLGNPGSEYAMTRHNVAWWLADRLAERYDLGRFRQRGLGGVARGSIERVDSQVVKPLTYMNRSGRLLEGLDEVTGFDMNRDLLVVVDDVALEPGRSRFRPGGSAGGHNGLKSIQAVLGTTEYPRLRIGVGSVPPGHEQVDWVLSTPSREDRGLILERIDVLVECVGVWVVEGIEAAMNRCNN